MLDLEDMHAVADGIEVVATAGDADPRNAPPLLVLDRLRGYLDAQHIGLGPISWRRIGEGQSNVTYLLRRGDAAVVLRRGPRPPLPRSTHDMRREASVQRLLAEAGIPVPRIRAVCTEESVLGVPFYLMDHVDGHVITGTLPAHLTAPADRLRISELVVECLAALHAVDVGQESFASLGRPQGYLRRQVERFTGLWDVSSTRVLPEVQRLSAWLGAHLPQSRRAALVHGDYRLGNIMFTDGATHIAAVLDWEMATLGDPLADLGYLTATWSTAAAAPTPIELSPVTALPGFLDRQGLVEHYVKLTGADVSALPWYQALALWKSAIFSEAIYTRWLNGERPGDTTFAPALETGVPRLLEAARAVAVTA
ncbi:phosphotransferase family protein [Phytohabitans suffuscus]|uniref:Acyl-CoA dehydrogenase n=1 Tax=Phytohabitans suffuscus TaxID=624315 RepID=A0A6F8YCA5_9ACTN|nr:phosphotransferase family protein [Phytohabitans suffuscus]BCB83764.1 acyl-CoA dehydrogenase [Phytohabitans suffuscus]